MSKPMLWTGAMLLGLAGSQAYGMVVHVDVNSLLRDTGIDLQLAQGFEQQVGSGQHFWISESTRYTNYPDNAVLMTRAVSIDPINYQLTVAANSAWSPPLYYPPGCVGDPPVVLVPEGTIIGPDSGFWWFTYPQIGQTGYFLYEQAGWPETDWMGNHYWNGAVGSIGKIPSYLPFAMWGGLGDDLGSHYGWMQVSYDPEKGLQLYDYAFETTPNTPLGAGMIPEPASLALLALGSAGLLVRRRRA